MSEEGVRLSKRVAALQGCSRSQAEALIAAGAVQVDGQVMIDPARRIPADARLQVAEWTPLGTLTVLLHKPVGMTAVLALGQAWAALGIGPSPVAGLQEMLPLPLPVSGLSVWSNDRSVVRRLMDRERPVETEWLLSLPVSQAQAVMPSLQAGGLRASLSHEREAQSQWRLVDKGNAGAEVVDFLERSQLAGTWSLRRQRIGRLGLSPLAVGQARLCLEFERF